MEEQLDNLAFRFFKLFAQYESTLKEHGFFRANQYRAVIVEWDRFANDIVGPGFRGDLGPNVTAADYILENPPMKQAVNGENKIVWVEVSNTSKSVQTLFAHIRRIRNNLFHGAKFNGTWFDPQRSNALLKNGLTILEHYRSSLSHSLLTSGSSETPLKRRS